jgi:hypothetical protein
MKITEFNFVGDFKFKTPTGSVIQYNKYDVVYFKEQTYIASKTINGSSPDLGERVGWICLSKKQVLYELDEPPFYPKVGDEWLNKSTGILYKRIKNEGSEYWVEL